MNYVILSFVLIGSAIVVQVQGQNPAIVNDILPEIKRVGNTGSLNCSVARLKENSVQWAYKAHSGDVIISINQEIKTLNDKRGEVPRYQVIKTTDVEKVTFTLVIARLTADVSGNYECTVTIPSKESTSWPTKIGQIIVQYPPVIRPGKTTNVKLVEQGETANITCDADSVPAPNITWVRSDGRLLPNGKAMSRGKTLVINTANIVYAGIYRCVADNSIKPPAEALTQVYVTHAPTIRVLQDSVGQFVNGHMQARLDCIVQGYPVPNVHWEYYDANMDTNRRLRNSDKTSTTKQATDYQNLFNGEQWYTLQIKNIQAGDLGDYYCVAENNKGSMKGLVKLFSTYDCQGALCTSQDSDGGNQGTSEFIKWRPLPIALALCMSTAVLKMLL